MARRKRRIGHRRNPTGTLLINPSRRGRHAKSRRRNPKARRSFSLKSLLAAARKNPRRSSKRRASRRSPRRSARRNPHRRSHKRRSSKRRNPLMLTNPRKSRRRGKRRNPSLYVMNPRKRSKGRRRNPLMLTNPSALVGKAQGLVKRIPLLGGPLAIALGMIGAPLAGAVGVLPIEYAMPYVSRYLPSMLRPVAYSLGGLAAAGLVAGLAPASLPYKSQLVAGLAFAGGAVDAHRAFHGDSQDLGDDAWGDDYGDDYGDDGSPLAATEYADASLMDAQYSGEDLGEDEIAAAELGRSNYRKRYLSKRKSRKEKRQSASERDSASDPSENAGQPGNRWGWMIHWIGFDNFQKLSQLEPSQRRATILQLRQEAMRKASKLLSEGQDTTMTDAETAGLLVV